MGREPQVGQQPREPGDRMGRQSLEHILQVGERIAPEPLAAADEAIPWMNRPSRIVGPDIIMPLSPAASPSGFDAVGAFSTLSPTTSIFAAFSAAADPDHERGQGP